MRVECVEMKQVLNYSKIECPTGDMRVDFPEDEDCITQRLSVLHLHPHPK